MPSSASSSAQSSMHSIGNQIGYKVRNIAHYGQPMIDINLASSHGSAAHGGYVVSYSTMDTIEGTVTVTANHNTRFEDIDIAFIGTSQVYVDRLTSTPSMSGRTEASHRFLTLKQPVEESALPSPRILLAGKKYTFPFFFTVPSQLLPRACQHQVNSDHVRNMHLQLPPSLGVPELAGFGGTLLDDLAPEMSKITYGIKVRLAQMRESDGRIFVLADKMKKIRLKPSFEEQPPLNLDGNDEYRPRQEKAIRKGLFKGKLGTITAETFQPKPLVIPGARSTDNKPITTVAKLLLRFDPTDEANAPPKLGSLATKLRASTYYASAPRHGIPSRSSIGLDFTQGLYPENITLSHLCVASAQWQKQFATSASSSNSQHENILRRDSGISDCSTSSTVGSYSQSGIPTPSNDYKQGIFYTCEIIVPIALPNNKNFIPTFHCCLISRIYTLSLNLSVHAPGVTDPSLHLKVPIQICAQGSDAGIENARARSVETITLQETQELFASRDVVMEEDGRDDELPPQYAAFAHTASR